MCLHQTPCPPADASGRGAARVMVAHPEQGWSLLCNGVIVFEDTGELLPDCSVVAPHRAKAGCQPRQRHNKARNGANAA